MEEREGISTANRRELGESTAGPEVGDPRRAEIAVRPLGNVSPEPWWTTLLAAGAIIAVTVATYWNSLHGEFMFDDRVWIVENPSIKHLWLLGDVLLPADAAHVGGRPIVSLSLAVNYALGRLDVRGYHAVNLAIHICAALVLFGVVRRTLVLPRLIARFGEAATPLAAIIALIWAVHPIQTEAVSYVIQRAESLVGLFYLLTLYCFIRGATARSPFTPHPSPLTFLWYLACFVACLLGMATKEVMVSVPIVLLLYDRTFLSRSFRQALAERWRLYLALAGTWLVLAWVLVATSFHADTTGLGVERFTPRTYLATEPGVLITYLRLAIWPDALCFAYDLMPPKSFGEIVAPALAIVALLGLTGWALVKRPALGFLGAAFFLILAPTSSIVPILDAAFEHRMYLPLAALLCLAVVGGYSLWMMALATPSHAPRTTPHVPRVVASALCVLAGVVVVALGWATLVRNRAYQSEFSIWKDTVEKRPANPRAHYSVARALSKQGHADAAIEEYRKTLRLEPNYAEAYQNWGRELALQGKLDEAIELFREAVRVRPNYPQGHFNLAHALAIHGQPEAAAGHYRIAIQLEPNYPEARNNLGLLLAGQGKLAEAAAELQEAIRSNPDYARGHSSLGGVLAQQGKLNQAAAEWRRALEINPDSADTHANLAGVLLLLGKPAEAMAHYREAIAIQPDFADARFHLGRVLDGEGKTREAIDQWREAIRLQPNNPAMLDKLAWTLATQSDDSLRDGVASLEFAEQAARLTEGKEPAILATLAAAQAETGQYARAVETAERALDQAADRSPDDHLQKLLGSEIERFSAGFPYRQPASR
jgi:protein O-mannosyl-transferase